MTPPNQSGIENTNQPVNRVEIGIFTVLAVIAVLLFAILEKIPQKTRQKNAVS